MQRLDAKTNCSQKEVGKTIIKDWGKNINLSVHLDCFANVFKKLKPEILQAIVRVWFNQTGQVDP